MGTGGNLKRNSDHAKTIRNSLAALIEEKEQCRREAGELRLAGMTLFRYLQMLSKGKLVSPIFGKEVEKAIQILHRKIGENGP